MGDAPFGESRIEWQDKRKDGAFLGRGREHSTFVGFGGKLADRQAEAATGTIGRTYGRRILFKNSFEHSRLDAWAGIANVDPVGVGEPWGVLRCGVMRNPNKPNNREPQFCPRAE